jgi:hypothetical protein
MVIVSYGLCSEQNHLYAIRNAMLRNSLASRLLQLEEGETLVGGGCGHGLIGVGLVDPLGLYFAVPHEKPLLRQRSVGSICPPRGHRVASAMASPCEI